METIRRSWILTREAWAVLCQDRQLALFPILSGIASALVLASFLVPSLVFFPWAELTRSASGTSFSFRPGPLHFAGVFVYYLLTYFVVVFFNAGLVACVRKRFAGEAPTLSDGLRFSMENAGRILQWALFSATIGTILRAVEENLGWLGRMVAGLLGMAWSVASFFVVPVLVYERVGPIEALRRAVAALRKAWGEGLVANVGMGAVFALLAVAGGVVLFITLIAGGFLAGSHLALGLGVMATTALLCVLYWTALSILYSTLQGIFLTACYEYATTGAAPAAFSADHVIAAWRPKKQSAAA
jgi:hypothetical protein